MNISVGSLDLVALIGERLAFMLALIAADTIAGVAAAIKSGSFDLSKLSDFYRSNVIPKLLGWAVAEIAIAYMIPGEWPEWLSDGLGWTAYSVAMLSLLGSIFGHLTFIGILPAGVSNLVSKVGVRSSGPADGGGG